MSFFEEYKPFRNYMRRFGLLEGLQDVWCYSLHIIEGQSLALEYLPDIDARTRRNLSKRIYPWDLDILAKELILNASAIGDKRLRLWSDLETAIDHIRRLENEAFSHGDEVRPDVIFEMHRIANRQFPWQRKLGANGFIRALKVFGEQSVNRIVERELGLTTEKFVVLGTAVAGHFHKRWGMSTNQDYGVLGIPAEATRAFFHRLARTSKELRQQTADLQSYDSDWLYTWNPLEATPLIRFDPDHPDRVICPIPYHLVKRATVGLFYDLVKATDFDNPFGNSFQAYVGEVARQFCKSPVFSVLAPEPYAIGSGRFHGTDWIVSDSTGHLFIECKTKRLTVNAKSRSDTVHLEHDLKVLAEAVVQNFKNIGNALDGKTSWTNDGLPVFSMILTLEDWFIFSPRVHELLENKIRWLAAQEGLDENEVVKFPYTIASANEFEVACQVIAQVSIGPLMEKKLERDTSWWSLFPFLTHAYPNELRKVNWDFQTVELNKFLKRMVPRPG